MGAAIAIPFIASTPPYRLRPPRSEFWGSQPHCEPGCARRVGQESAAFMRARWGNRVRVRGGCADLLRWACFWKSEATRPHLSACAEPVACHAISAGHEMERKQSTEGRKPAAPTEAVVPSDNT
eukprot:985662-Rhodomonas_salina.1